MHRPASLVAVLALCAGVLVATPATNATAASAPKPVLAVNSAGDPSYAVNAPLFADNGRAVVESTSSALNGLFISASGSPNGMGITITPPEGKPLQVGRWDALDSRLDDRSRPRVDIYTGVSPTFVGDLEIRDLAVDSAGKFTRFDIVFRSNSGAPGGFYGQIRLGQPESPGVRISPANLVFPDAPVGFPVTTALEWIRNTSSTPLSVGAASIAGAAKSDFSITANGCSGKTLPAGATCSLSVSFSPSTGGPRTARLSVPVGGTTQSVALDGSAPVGRSLVTLDGTDWVSGGKRTVIADGPRALIVGPNLQGYQWNSIRRFGRSTDEVRIVVNAPQGGPLALGQHPTVADVFGKRDGKYGATIGYDGRGCTQTGTENVRSFDVDGEGLPTRVDITFTLACDNDPNRQLKASLLWRVRDDITNPSAPTALKVSAASPRAASWKASASAGAVQTIVRLVAGSGVGASPTSGVALADGTATSATLPALQPGIRYSVAAFAVDKTGNVSSPTFTPVVVPGQQTTPTGEVLSNTGFEGGTGGWTATSSASVRQVYYPTKSGAGALAVTATKSGSNFVGATQKTALASATAGQTYTATCWVQSTVDGQAVQLRLMEYLPDYSSSTRLGTGVASGVGYGFWTKVEVSAPALKSGTRIVPQIISTNQSPASGDVFYDECSLQGK